MNLKVFHHQKPAMPIESVMFLHHLGNYAGPIHVYFRGPSAQCVRLKDGRLHVYQRGVFPDLLDGPGYILASRALADVLLSSCGLSVQIVPAQVIHLPTGESLAEYFEILPHDEVTPQTAKTVDATGGRAWHFNKSHLFVTTQAALELQRSGFQSLQFERGFDACAG
jgi:hypothetical protein